MPISFIYWLLLLLWLLFGFFWNRNELSTGNYGFFGGNLLLFILFVLIGLSLYGSPIKGG